MVDIFGHKIHEGDNVLRASTNKDRGIIWTIDKVVGFTPKMVKVNVPNCLNSKPYTLAYPYNVLIVSENEHIWRGREDKDAS